MKQFKLIILSVLLSVTTSCALLLNDYTPAAFTVNGDQATMSGAIDGSTPDEVQRLIDEHPEVTTIVMQNVEGSVDDEANLVAARLVRQHGFHTHVPADGEIASGGVDFFLAGVERTAVSGAKLGVHSWATGDGTTGDQVPRDDPQHKLYLDYYAEMGIPADFYWFTLQAAPAEDIYFMTEAELVQYQMVTR
ncbi:MAG: alpha/beta hydrolase [Chloroflexota bacterium]